MTLVSLSATVSNAEEFGEWLADRARRDHHDRRGAPAGAALPARDGRASGCSTCSRPPTSTRAAGLRQGGRAGQRRADPDRPRRLGQHPADARPHARPARASRARRRTPAPVGNGRRVWIPSRVEVVERLDREGLLPAIVFIFSRVGCDAAVTQCLQANVRLTTPAERDEIFALRRGGCRAPARRGPARPRLPRVPRRPDPRHRRPPRRACCRRSSRCVEELFHARAWCKVVFATETLALGINMPARTVVIEKLSKWNGETHADITPGEYTQLTGRAGRRGLDVEGHGVVLWQPGHEPARGRRPRLDPHLSAPLVVPAVVQHGRQPRAPVRPRRARASCWSSRSPSSRPTRPSSGWPGSCARPRRRSTGYAEAATCHLGDFMEYAGLRRRISDAREGRGPGAPRRTAAPRRSTSLAQAASRAT